MSQQAPVRSDEEDGCAWCGFAGEAPPEWWHEHRPHGHLGARSEETVMLCDLCYTTGRGYSETLEIVNHAANRILEALRPSEGSGE